MDEAEQKAVADLLRTVRIGVIVCAIIYSGANMDELMGLI